MNLKNLLNKIASKWLGLLILLIYILFLNYNSDTLFFDRSEKQDLITAELLMKEFRGYVSSESDPDDQGLTAVYGEDERILGYYILSENNRWKYSGYAGPVPILIKLDQTMVISEILMLENRETPRFLNKMYTAGFMRSWRGLSLDEASQTPVDTVSGVTLTSRTIIANLSEYLEAHYNQSPMGKRDVKTILLWTLEGLLLIAALINIFSKRLRKFRTVQLVLYVVVFGFLAGDFISLAMMRGFLTGAVPIVSNPILWSLFILSLLISLLTDKSFYCSHVCPFGAAQDLASMMTERKQKLPKTLKDVIKVIRPVFFGVLTLIILLDYKLDLSLTEPFAAFLYTVAAPFTIVVALGFLSLSFFFNRPWCRWFCPTGQFLEYFRTK